MKFILNEKYILNETKFILNEHFILNEATDKELTDLQNFLSAVSTDYKKVIDTATEFRANNEFLQNLATDKENADKAINDSRSDYPNMREWVMRYVETFEQSIKEQNIDINNSSFTKINDLIRQIRQSKDYETGAKSAEGSREDLKKNYNLLSELIEKIFYLGGQTSHNDINKDIEEITTSFEEIKNSIETIKADKILELIPDGEITARLADLNKLLPLTDERILDSDTEKYFDTCIDNLTKINAQLNQIIVSANDEKKKVDDANNAAKAEKERADSQQSKRDWAEDYKNCKTEKAFENFWNDYYRVEWGENAEKIKSFGLPFTQELEIYGFNSITNPFIDFLKQNDNINTLGLDRDSYATLHNARANGLLTDDDLRGNGKFKKSNLIFKPDLYKKDITDYLTQQKNLEKNSNKLPTDINKVYEADPETLLNNLMLNGGALDDLGNKVKAQEASKKGELRPITDIRQKLAQLGAESNKKANISEDDLDKLTVDINSDTAKKMLVYFIDYFMDENEFVIDEVLKAIPTIKPILDSTKITFDEKKQYRDKFKTNSTNYAGKSVATLLKKLAIKAGLAKETEKKEETK